MSVIERDVGLTRRLGPLTLTNGLTVSALYWAQAMARPATSDLGASPFLQLMPSATLGGYAGGVALLAAFANDLTSPRDLGIHAGLLAAALGLAAAAPNAPIAWLAFLLVGLGCSLTQRLLACATVASGPGRRSAAIGGIIAAGLFGITLARAFVPWAVGCFGWRAVLAAAAACAMSCGILATVTAASLCDGRTTDRGPVASARTLLRSRTALRHAALEQALVFAGFNFAWATYPRLLTGVAPAPLMGAIAGLGALAALASGRLCASFAPSRVARCGFAAVIVGLGLLALRSSLPLDTAAMVILDVGTQVALVANQSRAQSADATSATRGRLAAIVTTIGFAGGAAGAALGGLLG